MEDTKGVTDGGQGGAVAEIGRLSRRPLQHYFQIMGGRCKAGSGLSGGLSKRGAAKIGRLSSQAAVRKLQSRGRVIRWLPGGGIWLHPGTIILYPGALGGVNFFLPSWPMRGRRGGKTGPQNPPLG
jgi:hypothetical protein